MVGRGANAIRAAAVMRHGQHVHIRCVDVALRLSLMGYKAYFLSIECVIDFLCIFGIQLL